MGEPDWSATPLTMPPDLARDIVAHARAGAPNEVCGVLAQSGGVVRAIYPVLNVDSDPRRYMMDPKGLLTAMRDIERRGWELLGFYHSHPSSAPIPSDTDLAMALYSGHCYVIVSLRDPDRPEIRWFLFQGGGFQELIVS